MKIVFPLLLIFVIVNHINSEDVDCDDVPEDNPFLCCKFPQSMLPKEIIEPVVAKIRPLMEKGGAPLALCKGAEIMLEESGVMVNGEFSQEAVDKFVSENLSKDPNDAALGELLKTILPECVALVKDNVEDYQKENGMTKEECNAHGEAIMLCTTIRMETECPEAYANKAVSTCPGLGEFTKGCNKNWTAMKKFMIATMGTLTGKNQPQE